MIACLHSMDGDTVMATKVTKAENALLFTWYSGSRTLQGYHSQASSALVWVTQPIPVCNLGVSRHDDMCFITFNVTKKI